MDIKLILETTEGGESKLTFEPQLDQETFVPILNSALNTIPSTLISLLAQVPLLRPACAKEQENNLYVFQTGEKGAMENALYKYRKHLYDTITAIFSQVLAAAFPDIEYIERCKSIQQDYCTTHNEEEVTKYKSEIEEVVKYVRDNFEDILKELLEHVEEEKESN